jgi:hypothetical protein
MAIDRYLTDLDRALRMRGVREPDIVAEAREHLLDCCRDAEGRGLPRDEAEREAIRRFGLPDVVAAAFVNGSRSMLNRLLVVTCVLTVLAVTVLAVSVTVLQPPHVNYAASAALAGLLVAQSALTVLAVATARSTVRSWPRLALAIGGAFLVAVGMLALRQAVFGRHFEGYVLIVGVLLVAQGALTIVRGRASASLISDP